MVSECIILLRVEHLEQRCRRVASEVVANLIDLVHHEDGIDRRALLHALDDLSRKRTDVGSPVPSDGRFVVHATQRDSHELAAERLRDAAAE